MSQFLGQRAKMDQARDRANQAVAPSTEHQHRVALELFARGQRMAVGEDALVGGNKIDNRLGAAALCLLGQTPGNLIFLGVTQLKSGCIRVEPSKHARLLE